MTSASPQAVSSSTSAALPEHCYYCFDVLDAVLKGKESEDVAIPFEDSGAEFPLFVTWNIYSSSKSAVSRLRGCIGTFEATPLVEGLADYAKTSAFKDRRFSPISHRDLPRLECGVSLLTDFEECSDYLDWDIGTHGIYIHLPNPSLTQRYGLAAHGLGVANDGTPSSSSSSSSGSSTPSKPPASRKSDYGSGRHFLTATYLPDVMPAQGWTKIEAIDSAIQKAGWSGRITEEMRRSLRVQRYQSSKCMRRYDEWAEWKAQRPKA